jgi:hypothetical protein
MTAPDSISTARDHLRDVIAELQLAMQAATVAGGMI